MLKLCTGFKIEFEKIIKISWDTEMKYANTVGKDGTEKLVLCRLATNLQFVKHKTSAKCSKTKHN